MDIEEEAKHASPMDLDRERSAGLPALRYISIQTKPS
jgi:hypothetical protein